MVVRFDLFNLFNKGELETITALLAIYAAAFSGLKWTTEVMMGRSLGRKVSKVMADIDQNLQRIERAKTVGEHSPIPVLYEKSLNAELVKQVAHLQRIIAAQYEYLETQKKNPEGIRRWTCLYRPEGVDGIIAQFWFFVFVCLSLVYFWLGLLGKLEPGWVGLAACWTVGLTMAGIASWFSQTSFRLKQVGTSRRRGEIGQSNADLTGLRKAFLWFKSETWAVRRARLLYYIAVFSIFLLLILLSVPTPGQRIDFGFTMAVMVLLVIFGSLAENFRARALAERAMINKSKL